MYCGHACAKQHWKLGGHREVCASQDDQLSAIMDPNEEVLNKNGAYKNEAFFVFRFSSFFFDHPPPHTRSTTAPKDYLDPISFELMTNPVVCGT